MMPNPGSEENDPVIEVLDKFWQEIGRDSVAKSIDSLDEMARQLLTVAGILEGLYFHGITFSDLRGNLSGSSLLIYLAPIVLLLVTIGASLFVFFPEKFEADISSWQISKKNYESILQSKLKMIRIASWSFVVSVASLIVVVAVYLAG